MEQQGNENKLARAETKLRKTLKCLQEVVDHTQKTEHKNLVQMTKHEEKLKANWMNWWKSDRRRIDRAHRNHYQVELVKIDFILVSLIILKTPFK